MSETDPSRARSCVARGRRAAHDRAPARSARSTSVPTRRRRRRSRKRRRRLEGRAAQRRVRCAAQWWQMYNEPGSTRSRDQVSISNQNVLAAEAQFRAAEAAVRVTGAGQFPTVTAAPSATRLRNGRRRRRRATCTRCRSMSTYQADVWGSIRRSVAANAAVAQASAAQISRTRGLLYQAELAADYFQLQGLDAARQLLERHRRRRTSSTCS